MGSNTECRFLNLLLALEGEAAPDQTIAAALQALMTHSTAGYARVELREHSTAAPLLVVEPHARPADGAEQALRDRCDTGGVIVELELHKVRAPTYRDRELFGLLFDALVRHAHRIPAGQPGTRSLHEATHAFQVRLVRDALLRARGNVSHAARELRVTRTFIYKCMRAGAVRKAS